MTTTTSPTTPRTDEPAGTEADLAWSVPNDPAPRVAGSEDEPRGILRRLVHAIAHYRYHIRSL